MSPRPTPFYYASIDTTHSTMKLGHCMMYDKAGPTLFALARSIRMTACVVVLACARHDADEAPPAQTTPSAQVSADAFNTLRWLEGRWVGSGETQPPFYEEYKFVDDSTAVSRSYADSTFRSVTDSSVIRLRSGTLESVGNSTRYIAVAIAADSVVFAPGAGARNGFRWHRRSATEWIAVIEPITGGAQRAPVTYRMRKMP
jgi:hypothetical protein